MNSFMQGCLGIIALVGGSIVVLVIVLVLFGTDAGPSSSAHVYKDDFPYQTGQGHAYDIYYCKGKRIGTLRKEYDIWWLDINRGPQDVKTGYFTWRSEVKDYLADQGITDCPDLAPTSSGAAINATQPAASLDLRLQIGQYHHDIFACGDELVGRIQLLQPGYRVVIPNGTSDPDDITLDHLLQWKDAARKILAEQGRTECPL